VKPETGLSLLAAWGRESTPNLSQFSLRVRSYKSVIDSSNTKRQARLYSSPRS
jgi:hypothetical protein